MIPHSWFMVLDLIAFLLSLMGNMAMMVLASVAVMFAFKGIKVRE